VPEPANRKDRPGGGKYYEHPITGELFDSVTTVLDTWDKAGLKIWAGQLAAEAAQDSIPQLMAAVLEPDCTNTFNRCYQKHGRQNRCERCPCGVCERCMYRRLAWRHEAESSRRAQEGTEFHEAVHFWATNGGDEVSLRPEVRPYFETFLRWVADFGLVPHHPGQDGSWVQFETTLINRDHMYAGTSDAAITIRRNTEQAQRLLNELGALLGQPLDEALVRVDYKTREKPDERLYNDMPIQGVAYERCSMVLLADGTEVPAPKTHARMVLQLRPPGEDNPKGYTFEPMLSGDEEFYVFLRLLENYRWLNRWGDKKAFGWEALRTAAETRTLPEGQICASSCDFAFSGQHTQQCVSPEAAANIAASYGPPRQAQSAAAVKQAAKADKAAKAAAKRAPAKKVAAPAQVDPEQADPVIDAPISATQTVDPFELAQGARASKFIRSGRDPFPAGPVRLTAFEEEIPF
jgi:hypothetical protein